MGQGAVAARGVPRDRRRCGFTALELIVALALGGLLLTLALAIYQGAMRERRVVRVAEDLVGLLRFAQQAAVADTVDACEFQVDIRATHGEVRRLSGTRDAATGGCASSPGPTVQTVRVTDAFPDGVTASPVPTTITFISAGRLPRTVTAPVAVTIASGGRTRTITVEPATGRVQLGP